MLVRIVYIILVLLISSVIPTSCQAQGLVNNSSLRKSFFSNFASRKDYFYERDELNTSRSTIKKNRSVKNNDPKNNNSNNETSKNTNSKNGDSKNGDLKNGNSKNGDSKDKNEPPDEGNLALPDSQQPGPLVSFGGNIFEKKGIWQFNMFGEYFRGPGKYATDFFPYLIYSLSDKSSIFVTVPVAAKFKDQESQSSGIEDIFVQFEHAFYVKKTPCYTQQATIVLDIFYPTGSALADVPTGFDSPGFFVGATVNRIYVDWLFFTSYGALLTTSFNGTKIGNQYLYEAGIGKNIAYRTDKWILDWILEVNGYYNEKNIILRETDPNSGGNTILLTPSLWFSTKKLILQFGISQPINQNLFGDQKKFDFALFGNFAWTF